MRDHRNLRAFKLSDELVLAIYTETKSFPRDEMFGITSQMRRAAMSIACNIVEGCGHTSDAEYIRYLDIAFASAREVEYQISVAARLGYLTDTGATELARRADETLRVLSGLLKSPREKHS